MRVLVSGGAGYIGSHTVLALIAAGHDVLVVDDFSNSKPTVIARLESLSGASVPVHAFNLTDVDKTEHLFSTEEIDAVIHFAGLKAVGESVEKPLEYYSNNLDSTFSLLKAMRRGSEDLSGYRARSGSDGHDNCRPAGKGPLGNQSRREYQRHGRP